MKILAIIFLFFSFFVSASDSENECLTVNGETRFKNGWPPNLIVASGEKWWGIGPIENEDYPDNLVMPPPQKGIFVLCSLNETVSVPYEEQPIKLYKITSYENDL